MFIDVKTCGILGSNGGSLCDEQVKWPYCAIRCINGYTDIVHTILERLWNRNQSNHSGQSQRTQAKDSSQSQRTHAAQRTNQNSEKIHVADAKRGKTRARESRGFFFSANRAEAKRMRINFDPQAEVKTALLPNVYSVWGRFINQRESAYKSIENTVVYSKFEGVYYHKSTRRAERFCLNVWKRERQ